MESSEIRLLCEECELAWEAHLDALELNQNLRCPFCGNQHFTVKALEVPGTRAQARLDREVAQNFTTLMTEDRLPNLPIDFAG